MDGRNVPIKAPDTIAITKKEFPMITQPSLIKIKDKTMKIADATDTAIAGVK